MATAIASSTAAANEIHPQNAEPAPAERASGEKGLFRCAPEPLLPRKTPPYRPPYWFPFTPPQWFPFTPALTCLAEIAHTEYSTLLNIKTFDHSSGLRKSADSNAQRNLYMRGLAMALLGPAYD